MEKVKGTVYCRQSMFVVKEELRSIAHVPLTFSIVSSVT
jgi:hypothetical protein